MCEYKCLCTCTKLLFNLRNNFQNILKCKHLSFNWVKNFSKHFTERERERESETVRNINYPKFRIVPNLEGSAIDVFVKHKLEIKASSVLISEIILSTLHRIGYHHARISLLASVKKELVFKTHSRLVPYLKPLLQHC